MTGATRPSSARAVFDASVVVRALVDGQPVALEWLGSVAHDGLGLYWPSLVYPEVANTLLKLQRAGRLPRGAVNEMMEAIFAIPARTVAVERLTEEALALAAARGLSVYDACYAVLAETLRAPLLTADRRLAAATPNAVLIRG